MAKLLYIESSPRKERSASIAVALHFIRKYMEAHPNDTIETLDLWGKPLPPFNGLALDAKYAIMHGESSTPAQDDAWRVIEGIAGHFKSADKYVFSAPMWTFTIPYILKHYLDLLVQPGLTFNFTPTEGFRGLVTGKPALTILARGGSYAPGTAAAAWDKQNDYLQHVLGFIGFTDVKSILVEPTLLGGPDGKEQALVGAKQQAEEFATAF